MITNDHLRSVFFLDFPFCSSLGNIKLLLYTFLRVNQVIERLRQSYVLSIGDAPSFTFSKYPRLRTKLFE